MNQVVNSFSATVGRYAVPIFVVGLLLGVSGNPVLWTIGILMEITALIAWVVSGR